MPEYFLGIIFSFFYPIAIPKESNKLSTILYFGGVIVLMIGDIIWEAIKRIF